MTSKLMVSVSGVRGVVGDALTVQVISKYVGVFASLQREESGNTVILGRDSRVSGDWICHLVAGVLASQGYRVLNVGIVPTPTVQLAVKDTAGACGGIVVTASHNPAPYNGLKFIHSDSLFFSPERCSRLYAADAQVGASSSWDSCGAILSDPTWAHRHVQRIVELQQYVKLDDIRQRGLRVALDTVNGAGGPIMRHLLQTLGCHVVGLNEAPHGRFPRKPEPIPEHLTQLCELVRREGCDLGLAVDPDVDRLVMIDERGVPVGEEYTLCFATDAVLGIGGRRGSVVKNLSSSRAIDEVAARYGCQCVATPVGEIHVAQRMASLQAVVGGEGNGGVLLPELHLGRDAPLAAALCLSAIAVLGRDKTVSQYKATLPQYQIVKMKAPMPDNFQQALDRVIEHFKAQNAKIDLQDGVRIDAEEGWVHLRKSNTEPVYRVIGEFGSSEEESMKKCQEIMTMVAEFSK